jgi:hypothetical protein
MEHPIRTVKVEHKGKTYSATYAVQGQLVTVTYDKATKSDLMSGISSEALAKLLLSELLLEKDRGF